MGHTGRASSPARLSKVGHTQRSHNGVSGIKVAIGCREVATGLESSKNNTEKIVLCESDLQKETFLPLLSYKCFGGIGNKLGAVFHRSFLISQIKGGKKTCLCSKTSLRQLFYLCRIDAQDKEVREKQSLTFTNNVRMLM